MDITQVRYAVTVAKCGSLSKAAEALYLSQPALSQRIKHLETELGYSLFCRSPQGFSLTPAGKQFCANAQPLLCAWEQFQAQANLAGVGKRLRIGLGPRVYSNRLFDMSVHIFDTHTDIEVTFVTEAGQDFLAAIQAGTLDLAIDRFPPEELLTGHGLLCSTDLIVEQQCVLMSWNDPRSAWKHISFTDLQACTMISALEDSVEDKILKRICEKHGIVLRRIYRVDSIDAIMSMVQHGCGLVIGPHSFADYYGVAGVPLVPESTVSLKFISKLENNRWPEVILFRRYLEQICCGRSLAKPDPAV